MEDLIGYVILLFIFVVLPAILNRLARKRAAEAAARRQAQASGAEEIAPAQEEKPASQVERYLESLGVQVERRPARPQAAAPSAPTRPEPPAPATLEPRRPAPAPAESRSVYEAAPEEVQRFLETVRPRQAPPRPVSPPPPPRRPRVRAAAAVASRGPRPAATLQPVAEAPAAATAPASAMAVAPASRLGVLGHRPAPAELRRAVILSEIVHRPDFDSDPFERPLA